MPQVHTKCKLFFSFFGLTDFEVSFPIFFFFLRECLYQRLANNFPSMFAAAPPPAAWECLADCLTPGLTRLSPVWSARAPVRGGLQGGAGAAPIVWGTNLELHPQITGKFWDPQLQPQERLTIFFPQKCNFVVVRQGVSSPRSVSSTLPLNQHEDMTQEGAGLPPQLAPDWWAVVSTLH